MTLPCKGTTVAMTQESEQPISVKPNLAAENGKPFQGDLECIAQHITDLQQSAAHNPR